MPTVNPKQALIKLLGQHHEIQPLRGSDIVALNSKAILYLRYNKNAGPTKKLKGKFWFGITKSEYDKYSNSNLFIVCACLLGPNEVDYMVFPSYDFDEIKNNIPLQSGQWKFNILKTLEDKYLLQVSKGGLYDVTEHLNFLDFSPKDLRRISSPSFSEIKAPGKPVAATAKEPEPSDLETELLASAKDSSNPKRFEVALQRFFSEIGFKCKRIGGSGETDVLVYEPIRMIIDGKSTKSGSKSSINFTRIKGHKVKNNAALMIIASVGFDPAVCRDAELEKACLIEINALIELLRIHDKFVPSPYNYLEIFRHHGLINDKMIGGFRNAIKDRGNSILRIVSLIESMDFTPRTLDEIKGRLDLCCEQKDLPIIEKQNIIKNLSFLSSDLINIIKQNNETFELRYMPQMAIMRIRKILELI